MNSNFEINFSSQSAVDPILLLVMAMQTALYLLLGYFSRILRYLLWSQCTTLDPLLVIATETALFFDDILRYIISALENVVDAIPIEMQTVLYFESISRSNCINDNIFSRLLFCVNGG